MIVYTFMMSFGIFYVFKLVKKGINEGDWNKKKETKLTTSRIKDIFIKMYGEA